MTKKNKKNLKAWIKALRSGDYQQGTGQLYNKKIDQYCCLGVLCDLYRKENGGSLESLYFIPKGVTRDSVYGVPTVVEDWVGLNLREHCFVAKNDYQNWSFEDIATYLETEVLDK